MKKLNFLLVLLLGGCASATGPYYTPQSLLQRANVAQLIIYKEHRALAINRKVDIKINDERICELPDDSFLIVKAKTGVNTLGLSLWDMPGTSTFRTQLKASDIRYVKIAFNHDKQAVAGLLGVFIAEQVVTDSSGPFTIGEVSKESAENELRSMRQAPCSAN